MDFKNSDITNNSSPKAYSEKRMWQLAVEITNVGVWEFNALSNKVYFSEASKRIIGFEDDPTFGDEINDWNNRVHPEDKAKYFQDYQDHINGLTPMYVNEHRIKCKDGSYKWILDKGKIVEEDKNGNPIRFIGTHVDISKHVENQIKLTDTLNIITKQNNQLKNFAHIVTHNLKQHAANYESLLIFHAEATTNHEKEEIVDYLKTLSTSLTKTIGNLTEIVSVQNNRTAKLEKLYLAKEVDHILNVLNLVITENKAKVKNRIHSNLYIYYNPSYIESIIQNLLTNAIKYKHPDRDPEIIVESYINGKTIQIKITDNGIGIDLEKFGDSIFGLYKTFHKNDDAEGVGLYLIKNQIETYGGKIEVHSKVNIGTSFIITIPNEKKLVPNEVLYS
ncbi:PAS domain-containing sensor histidine kinase [Xanthomarina sp. F1114]|uniref:sensor histidine kinase n=1 Tax=Xanthomarina sp. F1114 TaxID=2996019 RepID=UPI00225E1C9A|nr:PAS domain-containing sensor histidine kinase [Xanthomarina sp. F1114]MCX7547683.1 PAS domain-containing sensor histidine kinase [Xanthomarina sp. F1114]